MVAMNGADFKTWRLEHGYTQQAIARELEVTRQTIVSWEKSAKLPRLLTLALGTLDTLKDSRNIAGRRATAHEARETRAALDDKK